MRIKLNIKKSCCLCESKEQLFNLDCGEKNILLCQKCLENIYAFAQKKLLPKSPKSIMSKDSRIKNERF